MCGRCPSRTRFYSCPHPLLLYLQPEDLQPGVGALAEVKIVLQLYKVQRGIYLLDLQVRERER